MKKTAYFALFAACFAMPFTFGCGGNTENTVIEAPAEAAEEEPAMDGMDDADYDAAMDAEMSGDGDG